MLTKTLIKKRLTENARQIRRHGIRRIGLFGSYARHEQLEGSDIDLLVDFNEGAETFDNFMDLCALLDSIFEDDKVEVVTMNGLSPYIGPHILKSVEYVEIAN